jgi:predicted AAA+ superfamily ATPase
VISRDFLKGKVSVALGRSRVVALLGPRQSGKTTLAREFVSPDSPNYFDCEHPLSAARLDQPWTALENLRGLVVVDEIQLRPDLFPILRVLSDREGNPAQFLILGSASPDLIKGSAQSLAGRVETIEVTPFSYPEVPSKPLHWVRGGYPLSFLAANDEDSAAWREAFVQRFLERDIPQLGISISSSHLRRFWSMLAHYHGQTWNAAEIGGSLGVSGHTMRHYLDILCETFMVRQLPAWHENVGKRQVKAPKIFFRDSGIFHTLMGIRDYGDLLKNPKMGASWEGYAVEEILRKLNPRESYSWGVHNGASLDLLCFKDGKRMGFEVKHQDAPRLSKGLLAALEILKLDDFKLVYPGSARYALHEKIEVVPLEQLLVEFLGG